MKSRRGSLDSCFFIAVNNTFLQISQQRKHKCEGARERERETRARATERKRK